MKSIKEIAKEWCSARSSKHCTEQCDGCWQVKNLMFGCEQHNMEDAYIQGANYVLGEIEEFQKLFSTCMNAHANGYLKSIIEQLKK